MLGQNILVDKRPKCVILKQKLIKSTGGYNG